MEQGVEDIIQDIQLLCPILSKSAILLLLTYREIANEYQKNDEKLGLATFQC